MRISRRVACVLCAVSCATIALCVPITEHPNVYRVNTARHGAWVVPQRLETVPSVTRPPLPEEQQVMPPLAAGVLSNLSGRKNETFEVSVISPLSGALNNCDRDLAYSFDDGPSIYHGEVEMLFDNAKAKYTSFVNGMNWSCIYDENNVQTLRKAVAAGHQIGSHTWSHAHLNSLSPEQQDLEIERLEEALWKIIGRVPAYFRPPYGECDKNCVERLNKKHGLTVVTWDVDSGDSVGASPSASIATLNALKYPQPHMPLSHETYQSSVETVAPAVVPSLQKQGYKLMTIQQCLGGKVPPYKIIGRPQERDETWTCANNV